MKKLFIPLLLVISILFLNGCSLAEDPSHKQMAEKLNLAYFDNFSLRKSIQFNDDFSTVRSKETAIISSREEDVEKADKKEALVYLGTSIATIDNGNIYYEFVGEKLKNMTYEFEDSSASKNKSKYDILFKGLVNKYGKDMDMIDLGLDYLLGDDFSIYIEFINERLYKKPFKGNFAEWLIDTKSGFVKIELFSYLVGNTYITKVSYSLISDRVMNFYLRKKERNEDSIKNDL